MLLEENAFYCPTTSGAKLVQETPSSTNPVFTFNSDEDTGMGRAGANIGSLIANGVNVLNWDANARVGIGTTGPHHALHVVGHLFLQDGSPEIYFETTSASHANWRLAAQEETSQSWEVQLGDVDADATNDDWDTVFRMTRTGTDDADAYFHNNVYGVDFIASSDIRLKNVIGPLTNALSTVNKLNAIRFTWKYGEEQIGFSAQEVLELVPEAVYGSEETEYGVAYGKLVPVLVEAIKELTAEVEALKKKVGGW